MSFLESSSTGADPYFKRILGVLYFWGSIILAVYILVVSVYVPFIRIRNHDLFNFRTTIALTSLHALLFGILGWSFLRIRLTDPGSFLPPQALTRRDIRALEDGTSNQPASNEVLTREFIKCNPDGTFKYCPTCQIYQPIRTSHCQNIGRCVAKFDHYCPILSSAIGIRNYKYYINFLLWMAFMGIYLPLIDSIAISAGRTSALTILLLIWSSIGTFSIFPLFGFHVYAVLSNVTTRESSFCSGFPRFNRTSIKKTTWICVLIRDDPDKIWAVPIELDLGRNPWKSSMWENWTSVMGTHWWEWLFPVSPTTQISNPSKWWEQEFNDATKEELRKVARERVAHVLSAEMRNAGLGDTLDPEKSLTGSVSLDRPSQAHLRSQ